METPTTPQHISVPALAALEDPIDIQIEVIPKLLNYITLNRYYGLHQSTISKLVMHGNFCNIVKVGRKNYFRKEDVEAWIDAQTIEVA